MATVIDSLRSISGYPIPANVFEDALDANELDGCAYADADVRNSPQFKRAKASIYTYLSLAPNVSQGGVSFSFTSKEKDAFKRMAESLLADAGDGNDGSSGCYGWMGENF